MAKVASEILTIQKFIFLLDDFHYNEFISCLESMKAVLSYKLAVAIRRKLPQFDSHQDLYRKIYGTRRKQARANFNQLAAHTFKLSANLAQNYPGYLTPNIAKLQRLVNEGNKEQAEMLALSLLDVAEKAEDFQCQLSALQFLDQQAETSKQTSLSLKLNEQLEKVSENAHTYIKIQTSLRTNLNSEIEVIKVKLNEWIKYYEQFHNHESPSIRIVSRFARLSCAYHFSHSMFNEEDVACLKELDNELKHFGYLTLPFMSDLKGNFGFLKLNSPLVHPNSKEGKKLFSELSAHYDSLKFSKSRLSTGQLYLATIAGTRLLTIYHSSLHRPDYPELLEESDRDELLRLRVRCENWLQELTPLNSAYHYKGVKMLYGVFLMLTGGSHIQKGIDELEMLLTTFQQINLKGSTDSIFMCLMVGYFSIKNYPKCASTFSRYLKSIKGKPGFEGNEVKIYAYYYLSQWLATGGKQYAVKLHNLLYKKASEPPATILELTNYFKIFSTA